LTNYNKFYSSTCSFYVDICHYSCQTCSSFFSDDGRTRCINCLSPEFAPLEDNTVNCVNKSKIPIEGYYFEEYNILFSKCHTNFKYVKECLVDSVSKSPNNFQYEFEDLCYQNCKDTGSDNIYENPRNRRCKDECDNNFFSEDNTCIESCPSDYNYFALDKYL